MKIKKIKETNWLFQITSALLAAIIIEIGAVFVGNKTGDASSSNYGSGRASIIPTLVIALVGIAIALLGIISMFKKKHYWFVVIALVVGIICTVMGLHAILDIFQLTF